MIKLVDILKENQYEPEKKIGAGMKGDVFSVKNYPEYVYKPIANTVFGPVTKKDIISAQKHIQKHPDVYAQIIEVYDDYYIQEKTNTLKFKQDLRNLHKDFKNVIGKYYYEWYNENNNSSGIPEDSALYGATNLGYYPEIENQVNLENLTNESKKLILKIKQFIVKSKDESLDWHSNNLGYDSEGNIKYFDIV
jgi:hypothetical protein